MFQRRGQSRSGSMMFEAHVSFSSFEQPDCCIHIRGLREGVKTLLLPLRDSSSIMQFFRMMSCYLTTEPLFQQGSCRGGKTPGVSTVIMSKAAERLCAFTCQNDSPPQHYLSFCGEMKLTYRQETRCIHNIPLTTLTEVNQLPQTLKKTKT